MITITNKQDSQQKAVRMLSLYERLNQGSIICKKEEAERFGVHQKTIQRDIEDMRRYLGESRVGDGERADIIYNRRLNGYLIDRAEHTWLTNEEIIVIAKILLDSRAFPRREINSLLDKLTAQGTPEQREHVKEIIQNERFHYIAPKHNKPLARKIWDLSYAVRQRQKVQMLYERISLPSPVERVVEPVGIIFSEYYFYLIAYISGESHEFPAIFRLDRINNYKIQKETFRIPYAQRFEEGGFRKRVQFMRPGKIMRIKFRFWGTSLEAVLDRLPTARVIHQEGKEAIVEAEVFGHGIKMWLLSQEQYLEVLSPPKFREDMKQTIQEMLFHYQ